jgi:uncharacterized membrane protein YgdD (TMEM256/DUF423 family)
VKTIGWGFASLALATVIGAFGTHALRGVLSDSALAVFQTGQQYHVTASFALIALGLVQSRRSGPSLTLPVRLLGAGSVVFSGSLYALALTGVRAWGAVTPAGGVLIITSLTWAAVAAFRAKPLD